MSKPVDIFRTPQERFENLEAFPYTPAYKIISGIQIAYVDVGEKTAPPVFFLHGEPTWSYLWRHVIAPLTAAGYRCIAPDLAGFGRSDKPTDIDWYSYDNHTAIINALVEQLNLHNATIVVHDWGGPIGLRVAMQQPERIKRIAMMNTGLFTGTQTMSTQWLHFRSFVQKTEDLPIAQLIAGGCKLPLSPSVLAAYDAPFPSPESKAGARAFPLLIPMTATDPGAAAGKAVLEQLQQDPRPKLMLWGVDDPILPIASGEQFAKRIHQNPPKQIENASHFLQEDAGEAIARHLISWLGRQ